MQKFFFINRIPVKMLKILNSFNTQDVDITILLCGGWNCGVDSDMT